MCALISLSASAHIIAGDARVANLGAIVARFAQMEEEQHK
jgi:hypothetical protein